MDFFDLKISYETFYASQYQSTEKDIHREVLKVKSQLYEYGFGLIKQNVVDVNVFLSILNRTRCSSPTLMVVTGTKMHIVRANRLCPISFIKNVRVFYDLGRQLLPLFLPCRYWLIYHEPNVKL